MITGKRYRLLSLIRKELRVSFNTSGFYVLAVFFPAIMSLWYLRIYNFAALNYASFREYFEMMSLLFVIVIPVLCMRVWAEERQKGSDELLYTMPFTSAELVAGKFVSLIIQLLILLLETLPLLLLLSGLGYFDAAVIAMQYAGVFLFAAMCLSAGQFISFRSPNQIMAAILTALFVILFSLLSDALLASLGPDNILRPVLRLLSFARHFESFSRAIVDSRSFVFFIALTSFFLFANYRSVELRRWS